MKDSDKPTELTVEVACPHCGEVWTKEMLLDSKRVPTHDFPRPCRAVCPGSGQFPVAPTHAQGR